MNIDPRVSNTQTLIPANINEFTVYVHKLFHQQATKLLIHNNWGNMITQYNGNVFMMTTDTGMD